MLRRVRVIVPGSTSNLGAGFDCIGLALDRFLDATFTPGPGPLRIARSGTLAPLDASAGDDVLMRAFTDALVAHGIEAGGRLDVHSAIPVSRGLGSSAAATVAGLALAAGALGRTIDPLALLPDAARIEGHPDNAAPALLGGLVLVTPAADGAQAAFQLPLSPRIGFAFAAPAVEVSTHAARAALPSTVPHGVAVRGLARAAALVRGLAEGDPALLRIGFDDELHVPWRMPLIPHATEARGAALDAGAWAVTVSGSGSGLIALCDRDLDAHVADAMAGAFAAAGDGVTAFAPRPVMDGLRTLPAHD